MPFLRRNSLLFLLLLLLAPAFYLDNQIATWIRQWHATGSALSQISESIRPVLKFISDGITLLAISILVYLAGKYGRQQKLISTGKDLFVGFLISGAAVQIIKHLAGRGRPRITDQILFLGPTLKIGYDSFPSGHTTSAFCLASIAAYHFPRLTPVFYFVATLIGLDRLNGLSHFLSDVMAGALLGIIAARLLIGNFYGKNKADAIQKTC